MTFSNKLYKYLGTIGIIATSIIAATLIFQSYYTNTEDRPIRIGMSEWSSNDHVFIAEKKGFFKKNGVDVEIVYDPIHLVVQKKFIDGEVDGVYESIADLIYHNAGGFRPVVLVYLTDYSVERDAIMSKLSSISELQNKTIGIDGFGTFSHLFVLKILEKHGMTEKDVKFTIIPAPQILSALENDEAEAAHIWGSTLLESKKKGYNILGTAESFPYLIIEGLAFDPQIIEERHDDIQKIVISLFEAQEFFETNPEESLQIMADRKNTSIESVKIGLAGVQIIDLKENKSILQYEESHLVDSIRTISDFFLEFGQITHAPRLQDLVDSRFVNSIAEP